MIPVKDIFDSVYKDYVNSPENGDVSMEEFNRMSPLGQMRLHDYMSGDIENVKPPTPFTSQKLKDYLSTFITAYPQDVKAGKIDKPADYYGFENMFMVGSPSFTCSSAESTDEKGDIYTKIELVDGGEFDDRSTTFIRGLKPSFLNPICKIVGDSFQFNPKDIGGVVLEYIRYPKFAKIVSAIDPIYNIPVIDEVKSVNYEYGDWARELLIYFISRSKSINTREDSLLQHSQVVGKLVRDEK